MILITNCEVFAPQSMGINDIIIAGHKVISVAKSITPPSGVEVEIIDGKGLTLVPGFIDAHVHIAGAGGEGGPATRTPEIMLGALLEGGITTVVGCLGTDGLTRHVESVLMKTKALRAEGVSAYMYTGSYQVPTPTITGDVGRDIALIEEVIGVGEVAISDHRSSVPSTAELIRIAEHARVGGMLGGKVGIVNLHMGDAKNPFKPIYEAVANSELNFKQFLPTHCNRNNYIFEDAKQYGKQGWVDITTSSYPYFPEYEIKPSKAYVELIKTGVPQEHITFTSDANGSLPGFDDEGSLVKLEMGKPLSMLTEFQDLVKIEKLPLETALLPFTLNPARVLRLQGKGRIENNSDADLLLLDKNQSIRYLIAGGNILIKDGKALKLGTYEYR